MNATVKEQVGKPAAVVAVMCGANTDVVPGVGKTVGEIRRMHAEELNIPPEARAFVNGEGVPDEHVLERDASLEFIREAGVKG